MSPAGAPDPASHRGRRPRVALLMLGLDDLSGGGGTERFFADVLEHHRRLRAPRFDLLLVCDEGSAERLRAAGRLGPDLPVRTVPGHTTLAGAWRRTRALRGALADVSLVHVPLIAPEYIPVLWRLRGGAPGALPALTVTMVDCTVADAWPGTGAGRSPGSGPSGPGAGPGRFPEQRKSLWLHRLFYRTVPLDGILAWYERFVAVVDPRRIRGWPLVQAARYSFVDTERFRPAAGKECTVVWAARLIRNKRPDLFARCVRHLLDTEPELARGWRFRMCGRGPLEGEMRRLLARLGLEGRIELAPEPRMEEVFSRSRVFVSTQEYENFTSLSMLEAMACGNAIVARDVGQTRAFVEHEGNGLLAFPDAPEGLAGALARCMGDRAAVRTWGERSREITLTRHCAENFLADLEDFWEAVLARVEAGRGAGGETAAAG